MKRFFAERPMVAWFIVAVAATVISAWIINAKEGPLTWLIKAAGWLMVLSRSWLEGIAPASTALRDANAG